jgi:hypothetical protein
VNLQLLQERPSVKICLEPERSWLYVDWIGYQTVGSVQEGCNLMLDLMVQHAAFGIINDNTRVLGIWSGASVWVAQDWFPRMRAAGMRRFAWVYSPTRFSRISTDTTLAELGEAAPYIQVFEQMEQAIEWLGEADLRSRALREWTARAETAGAPKAVIAAVIGDNWNPIRAWREYLGIPQAQVASRLGLSQVEYAAREAVSGSPAGTELNELAALFGVLPELLVVGSGPRG